MKKNRKEGAASQASLWAQLVMPLAALVRGELLGLVQELGLQAFAAMLEAERTKVCGPRYKHDPSRRAYRAGSVRGELALGGRRVTLRRQRVVDRQGREVMLDTWQRLSAEDPLDARALEQMTVGVATRKYARSLEALPEGIDERSPRRLAQPRRRPPLQRPLPLPPRDRPQRDRRRRVGNICAAYPAARAWSCTTICTASSAAKTTHAAAGAARRAGNPKGDPPGSERLRRVSRRATRADHPGAAGFRDTQPSVARR